MRHLNRVAVRIERPDRAILANAYVGQLSRRLAVLYRRQVGRLLVELRNRGIAGGIVQIPGHFEIGSAVREARFINPGAQQECLPASRRSRHDGHARRSAEVVQQVPADDYVSRCRRWGGTCDEP